MSRDLIWLLLGSCSYFKMLMSVSHMLTPYLGLSFLLGLCGLVLKRRQDECRGRVHLATCDPDFAVRDGSDLVGTNDCSYLLVTAAVTDDI